MEENQTDATEEQSVTATAPASLAAADEPSGPAAEGSAAETPTETPAPAEAPSPEPVARIDIDALVAEAEERGYRRGLNEAIERQMNSPALFDDLARRRNARQQPPAAAPDTLASGFLTGIRPGVWD